MRVYSKNLLFILLFFTFIYSNDKVTTLLNNSGLHASLIQSNKELTTAAIENPYPHSFTEKNSAIIASITAKHLDSTITIPLLKKHIDKKMSSRDLRKLNKFYASSLGKKIKQIKTKGIHSIKGRQIRKADMSNLSPSRLKDIKTIAKYKDYSKSIRQILKLGIYTKEAVYHSDKSYKKTKEEIEKKVENQLKFTDYLYSQEVLEKVSFLLCESLTEKELSSYAKFLARKESKKLQDAIFEGREIVYHTAIESFKKDLALSITTPYYVSEEE